jgi:hypothetical protein
MFQRKSYAFLLCAQSYIASHNTFSEFEPTTARANEYFAAHRRFQTIKTLRKIVSFQRLFLEKFHHTAIGTVGALCVAE